MHIEKKYLYIFAFTLQVILGVVFIISAYSKIISPGLVEIILVEHKIVAERETAALLVRILVALEFSLGVLMFQKNYLKNFILPAAFLFIVGFSGYLVYTGYFLRDLQNCGCFGDLIKMSPNESLIKNGILAALMIVLFFSIKEEEKGILFPSLIIIFSFVAVFVYSPINTNYAKEFSCYTNFINSGRTDLSSGDKLIAIMNTECEHCQSTANDLARLQKQMKWFPDLYILFFSEGKVSADSFNTLTKANFPYQMISAREFFNLIGQAPPRVYWLKDGKIKEKWDDDLIKNITLAFSGKR